MQKYKILFLFIIVGCAISTPDNPENRKRLATQYISELKVEEMVLDNLESIFPDRTEDELNKVKQSLQRTDFIAKLEKSYVDLLISCFTTSEIEALINFIRSPEGKSIMGKIPLIMADRKKLEKEILTDGNDVNELEKDVKRANPEPDIEHLIEILNSDDLLRQVAAAEEICKLGSEAKGTIPVLFSLLNKPDLLWYVPRAIVSIGPDSVPKLIEELESKNTVYLWGVIDTLGLFGKEAAQAVPALLNGLREHEENKTVKKHIISALGEIGPYAKEAVSSLLKYLEEDSSKLFSSKYYVDDGLCPTIKALGKIGTAAEEAVPILVNIFEFDDKQVRLKGDAKRLKIATSFALARIQQDKQYIKEIIKYLHNEHKLVWNYAADILAEFGEYALEAKPVLESNLLKSKGDRGITCWRDIIAAHYALALITGNRDKHIKELTKIRRNWEVLRFYAYTTQIDSYVWELRREKGN